MLAIQLKAKGLYTNPNPLDVPAGALLTADNVVIDRDGIIETRRGSQKYGTTKATMKKLFNYNSKLILNYASAMAYDSDGAGTWTDYTGTFVKPTNAQSIISLESNKNFYFTTNAGIKKIDTFSGGTVTSAGVPSALDIYNINPISVGSGWFTNAVVYRVVFGYVDANGNKILSAPSSRGIAINAGAADTPRIDFNLPDGLTTSYFFQIYRSLMTTSPSATPSDELQLAAEVYLTSFDIALGAVLYTDKLSESLLGATLYTSPSQQGILQENSQSPIARDMCLYKNMVLYANTITKQQMNITMISAAALNNNETITIDGQVFTCKTGSFSSTSGEFYKFTGGTVSEDIRNTSKSFVQAVNQKTTNTVIYAKYVSGDNDLPGQILIYETNLGSAIYYATTTTTGVFSPVIPTSGTTYASTNETGLNKVYISKIGQPEAVPILNNITVGSANKNILRIISLRDSVFVLKEDGVYRITGETPSSLSVSPFDTTTQLLAIDSAVTFNNSIYCYSTQGVCAISESGVQIVSRPIERTLLQLSTISIYTNFATATFGVSYESDRKYILCTVSAAGDTYSTNQFVWNSITQTWVRWTLPMTAGIVNDGDNKFYYCNPVIAFVMKERKTYTSADYTDDYFDVVVTSQSFPSGELYSQIHITPIPTASFLPRYGWSITNGTQTALITGYIEESPGYVSVINILTRSAYSNGNSICGNPISITFKLAPIHNNEPPVLKQWSDVLLHWSEAAFANMTVVFSTDISTTDNVTTIVPNDLTFTGLQTIRTFVPLEQARGRWLNITISNATSLTKFAFTGIGIIYSQVSTRSQ